VGVSVFLFSGLPGKGPGPHRHPYDEIQFVREGRGVWTVNGETFEGGAGDILVIKAARFTASKPSGMARSSRWTFISARDSYRRIGLVGR